MLPQQVYAYLCAARDSDSFTLKDAVCKGPDLKDRKGRFRAAFESMSKNQLAKDNAEQVLKLLKPGLDQVEAARQQGDSVANLYESSPLNWAKRTRSQPSITLDPNTRTCLKPISTMSSPTCSSPVLSSLLYRLPSGSGPRPHCSVLLGTQPRNSTNLCLGATS